MFEVGHRLDLRTTSGQCGHVKQYPASITAIPRPVSGTSRKVSSRITFTTDQPDPTSTRLIAVKSSVLPQSPSCQSHKSFRVNDSMPPTSFSMPRAMLPRSDSQIPYKERSKADLSGTREQFHIRQYSTCTPRDPDHLAIQRDETRLPTQHQKTPKRTEKSFIKKEILPKALMRPIQPSLPRSQTLAHLPCITDVRNISPSKPARKSDLGQRLYQKNDSKLDVVDALLESRMTRPEIESWDKVRAEVLTNQRRLGSRSTLFTSAAELRAVSESEKSSSHKTEHSRSLVLNLSADDRINTGKLEEQRRKTVGLKPLFVNTTLANTVRTYESSPLTYSTPHSETTYFTLSSAELSPDPRHVFQAEGAGYWTGRYVAATDRIRTMDHDLLLTPGQDGHVPSINSPAFETSFDKLDATRMIRVLEELKRTCKTKSALKSFVEFELQLRNSTASRPLMFVRSKSDLFWKREKQPQIDRMEHDKGKDIKGSANDDGKDQRSISNAQATFDKFSGVIGRKGGLVKSKTTGNLASESLMRRVPTPGGFPTSTLCRPRDLSQNRSVSDTRTNAIQEREARPRPGGLGKLGQSENSIRPAQNTRTTSSCRENGGAVKSSENKDGMVLNVTADTLVAPGSSSRALEAGRGDPPASNLKDNQSINHGRAGFAHETTGTIKETVVFTKSQDHSKRSGGQKSGDLVKKVVGASIREVRKMSRRVGSMGWGSSTDDLPVSARQ